MEKIYENSALNGRLPCDLKYDYKDFVRKLKKFDIPLSEKFRIQIVCFI